MRRTPSVFAGLLLGMLVAVNTVAVNTDEFDYFEANRQLIRNGVQSVLTCNGLFTSRRSLGQVFDQELAYLPDRLGDASGGNYSVDGASRTVSVGGGDDGPAIWTVFREGIGCVVMAPGMGKEAIDSLPTIKLPPPEADPATLPWPDGDLVEPAPMADGVSADALQAASDWAFNRATPEQDTISLLIVHGGRIVHERYAPGFDMHTRTRTWSTAKSIAATLIGMQVDAGKLALDAPLDIDWLPPLGAADKDPRDAITLRHVLHMSSGLYPVDSFGME